MLPLKRWFQATDGSIAWEPIRMQPESKWASRLWRHSRWEMPHGVCKEHRGGFLLSRYSMRKKVLSRREQQTHFSIFICSEETRGCSAQIVLNHVRPKRKGVCVLQSLVHSQKGSQSLYVAYSRRLWHPTAPYLEGTGPLRVVGGTLCLNFHYSLWLEKHYLITLSFPVIRASRVISEFKIIFLFFSLI